MSTYPINWNEIQDEKDPEVWDRLTGNFWLPEKVPVSNDIAKWREMSDEEHEATMKVFAGLTTLDTLQGTVGAVSLIPDAQTPHEEAVLTNIAFMESVHAKSYSNIFMTLASTPEINRAFEWARKSPELRYKTDRVEAFYREEDPLLKKAASTLLESFLFYSGFFWPLHLSAHSKLTNTADIIRLIIRDEAVHGYYIGYKFQRQLAQLGEAERAEIKDQVFEVLFDLYENECEFTREIYEPVGLVEQVEVFLRYNANKALNNLGYEGLFPGDETRVSSLIMSSLDSGGNENHDFFSGSGSSYAIGKTEDTDDDDWDF